MASQIAITEKLICWPTKPLSACIEKVTTPRKIPRKRFLESGSIPIISQEAEFINGYWDNDDDAISVEKPVVISGDHTQVLKLVDFDFVVGADGVKILKPKSFLSAKFLKYFLEANPIPSKGYARHFRHLKDLEVPLPGPAEQKRIVAVLDQAFAALDRADCDTETNLNSVGAIKNLVITGLLDEATAQSGTNTTLGELCTIARGGSPRPIKHYLTDSLDGVNWIKISDASASGQYIYETKQKIHPEGISKSRFVRSGSFLLTNSMSFGRPYILKTDGCIHDGWLVLEPDYCLVDQSYLYNLLGSGQIYREFNRLAAGTTVRNLNISLVKSVRVTLPPVRIQQEVVRKIAAQQEKCDQLIRNYQSRTEQIAELKRSLLHSAFAGNLV